jgi:hypothetical protein
MYIRVPIVNVVTEKVVMCHVKTGIAVFAAGFRARNGSFSDPMT